MPSRYASTYWQHLKPYCPMLTHLSDAGWEVFLTAFAKAGLIHRTPAIGYQAQAAPPLHCGHRLGKACVGLFGSREPHDRSTPSPLEECVSHERFESSTLPLESGATAREVEIDSLQAVCRKGSSTRMPSKSVASSRSSDNTTEHPRLRAASRIAASQ